MIVSIYSSASGISISSSDYGKLKVAIKFFESTHNNCLHNLTELLYVIQN